MKHVPFAPCGRRAPAGLLLLLLALPGAAMGRERASSRPLESRIHPERHATVVSEEAGGVVVRLEAPAPEWRRGNRYLYPVMADFGRLETPGAPTVPIRVERVGVPQGARPRITILATDAAPGPPGVVAPGGSRIDAPDRSGAAPAGGAEDPGVYGADAFYPADVPVRLGQSGALREQPYVELIFTPILCNAAQGTTVVHRSVTVRVDFGTTTASTTPAAIDPSFEDVYRSAFVNAGQASRFRGADQSARLDRETSSRRAASVLTPTTPKYKLTVRRDGIIRLDGAWVTTNAPDLVGKPAAAIRIEGLGQQVPITVIDANTDGTFNGSDAIEFFGQALAWDILQPDDWNNGDYTDDTVYWLYADTSSGLRCPVRPSAPAGGTIVTTFDATVHHEVGNRFVSTVPQDPPYPAESKIDHWYQNPPIVSTDTNVDGTPENSEMSFVLNTPGVAGTGTAWVKAKLLSDNYTSLCNGVPCGGPYHRTSIKLGATTVSGPSDWDGFREFVQGVDDAPATFSPSLLLDGTPATTSVTISLPLGRLVGGAPIVRDAMFQNWIELGYARQLRVDTDVDGDGTQTDDQMLVFTLPNTGAQVHLTGFAQSAAAIYEITRTLPGTQLADAVRITEAQVTGGAPPYAIDFQISVDGTLPPGTMRRFAVATTTSSPSTGDLLPAAVVTDVASNLHNPPAGADWLVIANGTLIDPDENSSSSWSQLVRHRRDDQGLRAVVVDVEDVYDEFSYGIADPQAIRDFIAYVYSSWPRVNPAIPVTYVLLVGDGSFDYKNGNGNLVTQNYLPPYMRSVSTSSIVGWMSDETYFSTVSGSDPLPDVLLGRWPVHSLAETNAVAQKILNYESPIANPPGQAWQSNVVFVADDTAAFEEVQDEQITTYLAGTPHTYNRTYERLIEVAHPTWPLDQVSAEVHDRILDQLDGNVEPARDIGPGAAVLSYVGHGSWTNWGDNYSFIVTSSTAPDPIDQLSNGSKLPLMLVADCLTGGFAITSRTGGCSNDADRHCKTNADCVSPGTCTNPVPPVDLSYNLGDDVLVTANKGAIGVIAPSHLDNNNIASTVEYTFFREAYGPEKVRNLGRLTLSLHMVFQQLADLITLRSYTLLGDPAVNLTVPAPAPPTQVVATPGNKQVTLSWTASPAATSYNVYRSTIAMGSYQRVGTNVPGASFVAGGLTNCTTYYFAVVSVNAGGFEGAWSSLNDGCGTGGACLSATPLNPQAPAAPGGVTAVDNENGGTVRVTWTPVSSTYDPTEYRVYWRTFQGTYQSRSAGLNTSLLVSGLANGTTYYFSVSAVNCSQGEGLKSSPEMAVVPHQILGIKPPRSVQDLRVYKVSDPDGTADALLQWTPPSVNIYGQTMAPGSIVSQEIYTSTTANFAADPAHLLATVSGTATSYTHENGAGDAQRRHYLVMAVDASGNRSGARDELPRGIDQLTVTRSSGNLVLSWPGVTLDLDGRPTLISAYVLYGQTTRFRRSDIGAMVPVQSNITSTSVIIPAPAGSVFYYSVIAVDGKGSLSPW